jgi:nicotinamidase/pyrazinamidase
MTSKTVILKRVFWGILGMTVLFVLVVIANLIILEKSQYVVTKGQPIGNYNEVRNALLVIDIQEATTGEVSTYPLFREKSEGLIKKINLITDAFNKRDYPVIFIRSELTNPLINLLNSSYARGSIGAKFDKRMKTYPGFEVVKKGADSFRNTNLDSILISNKISDLYIVGLDAAECVNVTVKASQYRNYKVHIIEEAVLSKTAEVKDSMMVNFKSRGVNVINIDSI